MCTHIRVQAQRVKAPLGDAVETNAQPSVEQVQLHTLYFCGIVVNVCVSPGMAVDTFVAVGTFLV